MTSAAAAVGLGAWAGLGLVAPLGAIGVMLLGEGVQRGMRRGLPAALGVATVDTAYCTVAVAAGSIAAPVIRRLGPWPAVVGGVMLVAVAVVSLIRALRPGSTSESIARVDHRGYRRFALFVGLTVINPATFVYFAAIALPLTRSLDGLAGGAFVAGVAIVSVTWQVGLIGVGAVLGTGVTAVT